MNFVQMDAADRLEFSYWKTPPIVNVQPGLPQVGADLGQSATFSGIKIVGIVNRSSQTHDGFRAPQLDIHNPKVNQAYRGEVVPRFQRHGGDLLTTLAADTEVLEGSWAMPRTVIMRFP